MVGVEGEDVLRSGEGEKGLEGGGRGQLLALGFAPDGVHQEDSRGFAEVVEGGISEGRDLREAVDGGGTDGVDMRGTLAHAEQTLARLLGGGKVKMGKLGDGVADGL